MKLTHEQISALSKVELNRAMIWCYSDHIDRRISDWFQCSLIECHEDGTISDDGEILEIQLGEWDYCINFLDGYLAYDLTMPLAYDNELCIELYKKRPGSNDKCWVYNINDTVRSLNDNPLRAICEVLLMIAMEREA